jgi:hypothetical protein
MRALTLAEQLVVQASDDVFVTLFEYIGGQREAVLSDISKQLGTGDRWNDGYLAALNDVLAHARFARGELSGR